MLYKVLAADAGIESKDVHFLYVHIWEQAGQWSQELVYEGRKSANTAITKALEQGAAITGPALMALHRLAGHFIGQEINALIGEQGWEHKIDLVAFRGFAMDFTEAPGLYLADGAAIAAETGLPVAGDFYAIDRALGGNGHREQALAPALSLAMLGVLRWREAYGFLAEETGARRSSIPGALWLGTEG